MLEYFGLIARLLVLKQSLRHAKRTVEVMVEEVADFWEYNTDDMLWRRLDVAAGVQGVPPPALYQHDMVAINTSVYINAGRRRSGHAV